MSHAEVCPICHGKGDVRTGISQEVKLCHGCGGTGWITVIDPVYTWIPTVENKNNYKGLKK